MEIEVIENKNNKLRFIIRGSNFTFVNALRRTIISEVPTLAIEDIILVENTSPVLDEIVAHRLGLVPLTTPADEFTVASECDNCGGEGCQFCSVPLTLEAEAGDNETKVVYTKDLDSNDDKIKPVSDKIPIAKLGAGQKITLEAIAMMGRGEQHAKWSPAVTCSYRYYPLVKQDSSKCTNCMECVDACPLNILEVNKKVVKLTDPLACLLCDLCTKACSYDSLTMSQVEGDYIFLLETTGALTPIVAFKKATEILKSKAKDFENEYKVALESFLKRKK
ncbi:MAG: DNA-directed RNA polymerase subunit D [Candidatus Heimdallarchaeota archaeon]|nr:DNA-directed RNA polymerase subunit D [Candidatus Heimdallarchaeota archaeon]